MATSILRCSASCQGALRTRAEQKQPRGTKMGSGVSWGHPAGLLQGQLETIPLRGITAGTFQKHPQTAQSGNPPGTNRTCQQTALPRLRCTPRQRTRQKSTASTVHPTRQCHGRGDTSKTAVSQTSLGSWFTGSIPWELSWEKMHDASQVSRRSATGWWKTTFHHQSHANHGLNMIAEARRAACILLQR